MAGILHRLVVVTFVASCVCVWAQPVNAREFRCTAQVNYRQLEGSGFTFLDDLPLLIEDYVNKNNWTNDTFEPEELIECSIQVVISENMTLTSFRAQLIITSTRPIYGTTAKTTVLQVNDNQWEFTYSQGTPLIFETERFDALTSVLDFYAYIMLGYDYDTFSEFGGEEWFQKAKRIQELASNKSSVGWNALRDGRRGELAEQLTEVRFRPLRQVYYRYHYEALDHFTKDTDQARTVVLEVLGTMQDLYEDLARQLVFDIFFSTKHKELAAIFEQSSVSSQALSLLAAVDPSHMTVYSELAN